MPFGSLEIEHGKREKGAVEGSIREAETVVGGFEIVVVMTSGHSLRRICC
jgi:hypothetical protein